MANILIEPALEMIESEEHVVYRWRREHSAGSASTTSTPASWRSPHADLGLARRLRSHGCSIDLAFRILA